ncbi:hypothetical protein GCM10011345_39320 [Gemmobacter megaterium]|nr:hypothetical protein GCM10011345_39320 [Gemmobacter megaterium]
MRFTDGRIGNLKASVRDAKRALGTLTEVLIGALVAAFGLSGAVFTRWGGGSTCDDGSAVR